jgi:pyruvate,water dikinase
VWREDDVPLRSIIARYAERDESEDPVEREAERRRARGDAERVLLDAVPPVQRPAVRLLLRYARERLPMRGVGKRAFLQALDVSRATARRLGEELASAGILEDADDFAYLTATELVDPPPEARERVAERQRRRLEFQEVELPLDWQGTPEPIAEGGAKAPAADGDGAGSVLTGLGVSGQRVEGTARVVTSPDFADVEPDEILVARTTDPSWSSIMFISSALVVDMGGALSHAAVVARELGIPCVVDTGDGTRALATGDRVRVDGDAGTVEILSRA